MSVGKHAGQRAMENLKLAIAHAEAINLKLRSEGESDSIFAAANDSLDYQLKRASHASAALTLHDQLDGCIAKAFSEAQLNPENPWHWRVLLTAFAEAYYPRRDLNQFWTGARLTTLLAEAHRMKRDHPKWKRSKREKELRNWITKKHGTRAKIGTKEMSTEAVTRILRMAADRKTNDFLNMTYNEIERGRIELLSLLSERFGPDTAAKVSDDPRWPSKLKETAEGMAIARLMTLSRKRPRDEK